MRGTTTERIRELLNDAAGILYHVVVVALSAGAALSLPHAANYVAQTFAIHWSAIERDRAALVGIEIVLAVLLIVCINYLRRAIRDRRLADMAARAGLTYVFPTTRAVTRKQIKKLKITQGRAKNLMTIGSTGYHTLRGSTGRSAHRHLEMFRGQNHVAQPIR